MLNFLKKIIPSNCIALLGGTFDPVHKGHLYLAHFISQEFHCDEIKFIPCKTPLLDKIEQADSQQRLEMLKLALADHKNFTVDDRELNRSSPSYTIETLQSLRKDFPENPLLFLMGSDQFLKLNTWHDWKSLLKYAHLVVVPRAEYPLPQQGEMADFLEKNRESDSSILKNTLFGRVFVSKAAPPPYSSTQLRENIAKNADVSDAIPAPVWHYIQSHNLYKLKL